YGRKNKKGSTVDMYNWQKDNCIDVKKAETMSAEELEGKIITGEMSRCEKPEYTDMYMEIIRKCGGDK
ncbi:MAG: 2-oxoacid:ferredoxin oxidoreductase subunit beta, partial [Firmicutes bacterium]|nr:2-oxoacid:ferredoxin oxidoreductase subunit beta [Bacillota bacterium]